MPAWLWTTVVGALFGAAAAVAAIWPLTRWPRKDLYRGVARKRERKRY